jgi:hypothetical protein
MAYAAAQDRGQESPISARGQVPVDVRERGGAGAVGDDDTRAALGALEAVAEGGEMLLELAPAGRLGEDRPGERSRKLDWSKLPLMVT